MGKFDGILICTDFDGTLAYEAKVSPENIAAIRYFTENGGKFSISSGRDPRFTVTHIAEIGVNAPITGFNGAAILDCKTGKYLFRGGRNGDAIFKIAERVFEEREKYCLHDVLFHCADTFDLKLSNEGDGLMEKAKSMAAMPVYNIVFCTRQKRAREMRAWVETWLPKGFTARCSWDDGMEIIHADEEKGNAMVRMRDLVGAKLLVGAGNDENDITLLTMADIGYAVADAVPEVLAAADKITLPCNQNAMAAIIKDLEEQIDRGEIKL